MTFKLNPGDVCRLKKTIPGIFQSDDWKTGLYRVKEITLSVAASRQYANDPRYQVYRFEKIKKDGTAYKTRWLGYNCQAWDKFIDAGQVEIIK